MADIIYPATLPNASVSLVSSGVERRFTNGMPLSIRAFERGYRGTVKVHLQLRGDIHAHVFRNWLLVDLNDGLNWFTANWPNDLGFTFRVYRFKPNTMQWSYNGFDYYAVDAECYVRGRSLVPQK